jgi:acyl-CoA hydrolase
MSQPVRPKKVSESRTVMTELVMPNDTNPMGNLMGGNLLRFMDVACAVCAGRHCETPVVTASVDHVSFKTPIRVGEVITLEASVTRAFSTSIEVYVEVFAADMQGHNPRRSNHAYFTFVGLDEENGSPVKVPEVIPLTESEQRHYEAAPRRREVRLVLSGRMQPTEAKHLNEFFGSMNARP